MFVFVGGDQGDVDPGEIETVGPKLRGHARSVSTWRDQGGRVAVAASVSGILPEDAFDAQPLISQDLVFCAQARLDNRTELLARLGLPRQAGETLADNDLLMRAYERWGEDCMPALVGDYAFVAWHRDSGKIVAVVDHIGAVDLYYAHANGRIVLSTQLGPILAHPRIPNELDLVALGLLIAPKIELATTPYRHVRSVIGGHVLTFQNGVMRQRRWWRPERRPAIRYRDPADYVAHAGRVFDAAVEGCLRSSREIAATVSGGLDSTLVAATAARRLSASSRGLAGYTSVPEPGLATPTLAGWDNNDLPFADAVAQFSPGLSITPMTPGGLCSLDVAPAIHALSGRPVRNGANAIWLGRICAAAAADGRRVVLTGQRGNLSLSAEGDGAIRSLLLSGRWRSMAFQARVRADLQGRDPWRLAMRDIVGPNLTALVRRGRLPSVTDARPGAALYRKPFLQAHRSALASGVLPSHRRSSHQASAAAPIKSWRLDTLVQWGVELRDPTADRILIETLNAFPAEAFSIDGNDRGLARAMGKSRLPDSVRLRRTRGAQVPELPAIIVAHAETYRAVADQVSRSPQFHEIVDIAELEHLTRRAIGGSGTLLEALTLDRALSVGMFIVGIGQ